MPYAKNVVDITYLPREITFQEQKSLLIVSSQLSRNFKACFLSTVAISHSKHYLHCRRFSFSNADRVNSQNIIFDDLIFDEVISQASRVDVFLQ